MNNKGADQTALMCRLVCVFVAHKSQRQFFSHCGPYVFVEKKLNKKNNEDALLVKGDGNPEDNYVLYERS